MLYDTFASGLTCPHCQLRSQEGRYIDRKNTYYYSSNGRTHTFVPY
jgi:hypothetical protein